MTVKTEYQHGQFNWVDLSAHDASAAKSFYGELFGWTCADQDTQGGPPYAIFQLDGRHVAGIGQMNDEMKAQGIPPFWNCYVNVDDVEAAVQKTADLGGTVTMPAMKVLDAGWMAFIQDPTGANVALWQKDQHIGAQLVNSVGACCWNELATRDVEKAKEFYGRLLGWTFEEFPGTPTKYFVCKVGDNMNGGLMQMDEHGGEMPPCWCVYFSVADADVAAEKVTQLGGKVIQPPFDIPVGRIAVVSDPQGAVFYVIKLSNPPE